MPPGSEKCHRFILTNWRLSASISISLSVRYSNEHIERLPGSRRDMGPPDLVTELERLLGEFDQTDRVE